MSAGGDGDANPLTAVLESFWFPGRSADFPRSLALACLLTPTVVVPVGYALTVAKAVLGHRSQPSNLELSRSLAHSGAAIVGVGVVYTIPAAAAYLLTGTGPVPAVLVLLAVYLLPAALVFQANQGARAALRASSLIDVVLTTSYLRRFVESVALIAIGGLGVRFMALNTSKWIGAVAGIWLAGYLMLVIAHRHAVQYDSLRDRGRTVDHGSTGVPV